MSKIYKFAGKCKWAKVHKVDPKYQQYTIDVYLDEPSMALYKQSGCQMKIKENEDGEFVTFRRAHQQLIKQDLVEFGKPTVIDREGKTITENVGNGSDVVVKVEVYDSQKGKGHRLEAVCVLDLVPFGEKEEIAPEGLADLPDF